MSEQAGAAPSERVYDVVVIGGGPVGVALAQRTCADGLRDGIVEKELLGGDCDYWACVPSKALLRPVAAIADARRVESARKAVEGHDDQRATLVKGMGADLVRGHGRLDGPRRVTVQTRNDGRVVLFAQHAVAVCTGSARAGRPLNTAPWGAHAFSADFHAVPQVFFCDPEATAVGLSAEQAERARHRVRAVDVELGKVKGASLYADEYRGRASDTCSASRSSARASPSCPTLPPSPSPARCPSTGSGTPSSASRRSARSGCACWRLTGPEVRGGSPGAGAVLRTRS